MICHGGHPRIDYEVMPSQVNEKIFYSIVVAERASAGQAIHAQIVLVWAPKLAAVTNVEEFCQNHLSGFRATSSLADPRPCEAHFPQGAHLWKGG
jgi:hypothetical protein